jgi:pimeloyl-ACP methyl ester carboxylesterase
LKVILEGLAVEYRDEGRGPVVLLLHGWGINSGSFDVLSRDLAGAGYRVLRPDLPGFGASERPRAVWGVSNYADFIKAFTAKLGAEPDLIIGHSFGGRIAIKLAGLKLLKPKRLVLMNSAGIKQSQSLRNQGFKIIAKIGKFITNLPIFSVWRGPLRQRLYGAAGSTDYLQAGPMKAIFLKTIQEDLRGNAAEINIPTLLIWGKNDVTTPVKDAQILKGCIPSARLVMLDAGHFVYLDQPDQVAGLIKEFGQ